MGMQGTYCLPLAFLRCSYGARPRCPGMGSYCIFRIKNSKSARGVYNAGYYAATCLKCPLYVYLTTESFSWSPYVPDLDMFAVNPCHDLPHAFLIHFTLTSRCSLLPTAALVTMPIIISKPSLFLQGITIGQSTETSTTLTAVMMVLRSSPPRIFQAASAWLKKELKVLQSTKSFGTAPRSASERKK